MKARIIMIIMAAALIALPTMAQDWQSTSTMQSSGSVYTPQVTAVGSTSVASEATTTENYGPAKTPGRIRRDNISSDDDGWTGKMDSGGTNLSPVGDAVLPLMLMAFAFVGYTAIRRKKQAKKA